MFYLQFSSDNDRCLKVKLSTADYGEEISWNIGSCQSNAVYDDNAEYTQRCCLKPGTYNLECRDSAGDGWNGGYIEVNGNKYCDSFTSASDETSEIFIESTGKCFPYFT